MKRQSDDLEMRVAHRKHQLITEIIEHKKNSSRSVAAGEIERLEDHLSELSHIVKADKWTNLSAGARLRLAQWIAR